MWLQTVRAESKQASNDPLALNWTKDELALLGTRPYAEVAELTGRTFGTVWQKRRALGIDQPELRFRKWTAAEDKFVGTGHDAHIAHQPSRTESAVKSRQLTCNS